MAYILLYVDDVILTESINHLRTHFITLLGNKFAMNGLGPLSYNLEVDVTRILMVCSYVKNNLQ